MMDLSELNLHPSSALEVQVLSFSLKKIRVLLGNEGDRISIQVIHQSIPLFKRKTIIESPPIGNAPFKSYSHSNLKIIIMKYQAPIAVVGVV
jgi:hypothetical protein